MDGVPGTITVRDGVAPPFEEPLPRVATTAPAAAAPPAIARMAMSFAEIPPAAAAAVSALVWFIEALAVRPWCEAFTRISYCPFTLFGRRPRATAWPFESVVMVRLRAPFANVAPAPWLGNKNVTAAPATGFRFSSYT